MKYVEMFKWREVLGAVMLGLGKAAETYQATSGDLFATLATFLQWGGPAIAAAVAIRKKINGAEK